MSKREKDCKSKKSYDSGAEALRIAKSHSRMFSTTMMPYQCLYCPKWHIQSQYTNKFIPPVKGKVLCI